MLSAAGRDASAHWATDTNGTARVKAVRAPPLNPKGATVAEAICRHCGVGINWIMMRSGSGWCHSLGGTRCDGLESRADPDVEGRGQ